MSLSLTTSSEPAPGRGRRLSCTVALAVAGALAAVALGGGTLLGLFDRGGGHNDAAEPPGKTSPGDAAAPPASLPKPFIGTWKGSTQEENGLPHGELTAVFTPGGKGQDVVRLTTTLSVLGTSVECHSIGRLTSAEPRKLRVTDRTDPGRPGSPGMCTGTSATLTFTLNEDGTLAYRSDEDAAGNPYGTLRKSG